MSPVLGDADRLMVGSQLVDKAYVGAVRVYPKFLPPDLSGNVAWLDANQLVGADGAAVSPWPNLAPAGVNGTISGAPAPTKRLNILAGKPVVRFINGQGVVTVSSGSGFAAEYTGFIVAHMTGTANARIWGHATKNYLIGWWGGYMDKMHLDGWSVPDPSVTATTAWKMYSVDGTATVGARFFSNGVYIGICAGTKDFAGGYTVGWALNEYSACEVAEVIWYNRKLADADRQLVEAYLRKKWGFP